jgi:hypothetical protein
MKFKYEPNTSHEYALIKQAPVTPSTHHVPSRHSFSHLIGLRFHPTSPLRFHPGLFRSFVSFDFSSHAPTDIFIRRRSNRLSTICLRRCFWRPHTMTTAGRPLRLRLQSSKTEINSVRHRQLQTVEPCPQLTLDSHRRAAARASVCVTEVSEIEFRMRIRIRSKARAGAIELGDAIGVW